MTEVMEEIPSELTVVVFREERATLMEYARNVEGRSGEARKHWVRAIAKEAFER